jgi:hypothetical protein
MPRATTVAIREQIYYGYEAPMSRARGDRLLFGRYEIDGSWSEAVADLLANEQLTRGSRLPERDHVEPVGEIAKDLPAAARTAQQIVELMERRLMIYTLLPTSIGDWVEGHRVGSL